MIIISKFIETIKKHNSIILVLLTLNVVILFLALLANAILKKEVSTKNIQTGITQSAETANYLDNIVYLGENVIDFLDNDMNYVSESQFTKERIGSVIEKTFISINKRSKHFFNLYIVYDDFIISALDKSYTKVAPYDREWHRKASESEGSIITNPYEDILSKKSVVTISKKNKEVNSVIGLDIDLDYIHEILSSSVERNLPITSAVVVNDEGIIIAHTIDKYRGYKIDDSSLPDSVDLSKYLDEIFQRESGQIPFEIKGNNYALVYKKTASNWYILYTVNMEILNSEIVETRVGILLIYIFGALLANISIILYYQKRNIAIRLKGKAEKAEEEISKYRDRLEKMVAIRTEALRMQGDKLEKLNTIIIENLADIVEFRDLETGTHIKRIKLITHAIATKVSELYPEYKLDNMKVDMISKAAALHDIGKIGISDSILLKPGKLTQEEYEGMKKHTLIGEELVNRILNNYDYRLAYYAKQICRSHHERYDGKGYPDNLSGDVIPIAAQIVGIADCYDALSEERIYKKAFPHDIAVQMINNAECGVFSDKILKCFNLVAEEILINI